MKIYLAGPIKKQRQIMKEMTNYLREQNHEVYLPSEHKIENEWNISNQEWGKKVFDNNIEAINNCDLMIVASFDNTEHHDGNRFESGYAYSIGKKILLVHFEQKEISLMIANGCYSHVYSMEEFKQLDLNNLNNNECTIEQT